MAPSRRDFLLTSASAALGAAVARPLAALAHLPQAPQAQPVFTPIRRNVGTFTMRGGTVGWLVNRGGVAVVDTQFLPEGRVLLEGLQARSNNRGVDVVLNTHHHGDHSSGNAAFRGVARRVVAHGMADQHMRRAPQWPQPQAAAAAAQPAPQQPPAAQPPAPQPAPSQQAQQPAAPPLYPDTTFTHSWSIDLGDERMVARHHGRAHTSGDAVITFERANVVHMGDLMFHRRHPVVDRPAGASMRNWIRLLPQVVESHARDTIYIFGHGGQGLPVTGSAADLLAFRDYLGALFAHIERLVAAGRTREEILAMREPLAGFEAWGAFGQAGPRDPLTVAYEEVTTGA